MHNNTGLLFSFNKQITFVKLCRTNADKTQRFTTYTRIVQLHCGLKYTSICLTSTFLFHCDISPHALVFHLSINRNSVRFH